MNGIPADFGIRIKVMRKRRLLTQAQLALMLGLRANCISRYETNAQAPTLSTLVALCRVLHCTPDDLVKLEP